MFGLRQMEIFYQVAVWHSFSKAAVALSVSKAYVSSQVTKLEQAIGGKLLQRSTRKLSLTQEGRVFFESCAKVVAEKQTAAALVKNWQTGASGELKLTAPPSLVNGLLIGMLPEFMRQYPKVILNLDSSAAKKDLVQYGYDLAIQLGHNPQENYVAKEIGQIRSVVCAADEYLDLKGIPNHIEELLKHDCLIYSADPVAENWPFGVAGQVKTIRVPVKIKSTDSQLLRHLAINALGITRLPAYVVKNDLQANKLIELFKNSAPLYLPCYAIYPANIKTPAKVKRFIEFLTESIANACSR